MGWFGGNNPANEANKYLGQIPGAVSPYYNPYINQGQTANKNLMEQFQKLLSNPGDLYSELGKGFKESPGYQFKLREALGAGTNAAAAGGMAGSLAHREAANKTAYDISDQEFENYINHVLGLYGTGLQGEQGLGEQGFKASLGLGDILGSNLAQQGNYAYQGQAADNANKANFWNNLISGGATVLGGALGGPLGGLLTNTLTNKVLPKS